MRILYLCADPGVPILGRKGCSTHVREVVRALARAGHHPLALCANRGEDEAGLDGFDIVETPPYKARWLGHDLRLLLYNRPFAASIEQSIQRFKPDLIYERFSLYSQCAGRIARTHGLPRILEVNAFLSDEQVDRIHFHRLARWSDKRVVRQAERVIVVSEPLRQMVEQLGVSPERIHKMPMTVDVNHFTPEKSGREIEEKFGLPGKYVIGYVGTLTAWHGINLLYDVARRLEERMDNFVFFLVGGDDQKVAQHREKACQLGLQSRFIFAGSAPHERIPEYVRAMHVTLVPDTSYWSSPTKLFEYQAAGIPTVAPRYPSVLEAMEDGEEGLLFEPKNIEQFTDRLAQLGRSPDLRRQMGDRARRRVLRSHSIDQQVAGLVAIFRSMLAERRAGGLSSGGREGA